ncbi:hypothetical protein MHYP_G00233670 [Metynnis hypsauchen]
MESISYYVQQRSPSFRYKQGPPVSFSRAGKDLLHVKFSPLFISFISSRSSVRIIGASQSVHIFATT